MEKENVKFDTGNEIADEVLSEMLDLGFNCGKSAFDHGYLRCLKDLGIIEDKEEITINHNILEKLNFESRNKILYAISCIQENFERRNNKDGGK